MDLIAALSKLATFAGPGSLTWRIAALEREFANCEGAEIPELLSRERVDPSLLEAGDTIKQRVGQINVLVHALGILLSLPHILDQDETVQALSLGAGNTGKEYDLETDRRVAEFKFITWRGGPESIRHNSIFIDLMDLLEDRTGRARYLYLMNKDIPMKFLRGNRAITSVLSRNGRAFEQFHSTYGDRYTRVSEWFFNEVRDRVEIVDLSNALPELLPSLTRAAKTEL